MEFKASAIAGFLHGEVEGDPDTTVSAFAKIEEEIGRASCRERV